MWPAHRRSDSRQQAGAQCAEVLVSAADLARPVLVVDVGANPVNEPPYRALLDRGLGHVVGFEPHPEAYAELAGKDPDRETYLPVAVGAPGRARLRVYRGSGFTSTFEIDQRTVELLGNPAWRRLTKLSRTLDVDLVALDDIDELPGFDLLKIDIQGGELAVFQHGRQSLSKAVAVITEVAFFPLYENAPTFADVHAELVAQGFLLHKFLHVKQRHLFGADSDRPEIRDAGRNQVIDGDAVYLRDLRTMQQWPDEQLRVLALLAHFVFHSTDVAARALEVLEERGAVSPASASRYLAAGAGVRGW